MGQGIEQLLTGQGEVKRPLICIEINPPRGTDVEAVLQRYVGVDGIDFVNVTDSALAKMKLSGLIFGALFKQRFGIEPLVNLSCRDRNVIAMQSDLLGAWSLGVRSIVALTGDAVTVGDMPEAKGVFEVNSIGLLNIISTLRDGSDMAGVELKGKPDYVAGVVVNPNARNHAVELKRLARKRDAGAVYALSQPVFDIDQAQAFFEAAKPLGIDIFVGLMPFKSARAFEGIAKVPGIKVADTILERVRTIEESEVAEFSLEVAMEIAARVKDSVRGFHVISGGAPLLAIELVQRLVSWSRN
ncbi:MAG: methylenetetrahydrofolate reductase [Proteobacteria bacterium]|nr:methylenetetrahydrofolate reductase [Pseudomonadota bacterium]